MGKEIFKKIYKTIKEHNVIVIARHIGPDPDAVASQIALRDSIRLTFPQKKVYAVGINVARFKFLGSLDRIDDSLLENPLLIAVDLPDTDRLDGVSPERYKNIIRIDHHPFESSISNINYIDESASSASEMIVKVIYNTRLKMDESIAAALYTGMVSDNDRFLFDSTSSETFLIASTLLKEYKLDLKTIYNNLYERPLNEVRFQAFITLNMTVTENNFAYIKISNEIIREYGFDASSASNMINNFNFIKEIIAWTFIVYDEKTELYRVNIRSRGPVINETAMLFNGGGHKFAAGARIKDNAEIDLLLQKLDEVCKNYQETDK